jgi:hypothetical protein
MQVCEQVYNPRTDEYEEYCYDDGTNEIDESVSGLYDTGESVSGSYDANFSWGDAPGETGSNTVVDPKTGNITYTYDDGSTMTVGPNGMPVANTESSDAKGNSVAYNRALAWTYKNLGSTAGKVFTNMMANPGASLITALAAAKAFSGTDDTGGYNVPVPKLDAVRQQIDYGADIARRPGASGLQYFTDPRYVKQGDAASLATAQGLSNVQAQNIVTDAFLSGRYDPTAEPAVNPYIGKMKMNWNPPATTVTTGATGTTSATPAAGLAAIPTQEQLMDPNYKIGMASGGIASARYLQGGTDGMADKIPANIDGEQAAALSHGEFVIPADVVSHLGNGNSEAGADKLYQMMARIRKARTGNEKQGKKINPDKFMPGGLAAAYAAGGSVKGFNGATGSTVANTATSAGGVPLDTSKTSTLSPWAGDYITNFLGQGAALANAPQQTYGGPLTAGASDLQQQGFAGMSEVAKGGFQPNTFTSGTFGTAQANQYMNPYLTAALQPQIDEARRQSQITQQQNAAKMTGAGAFGGGRQAILDAETQRSLGANLANITGTGYNTAYDKAMAQFNAEQNRGLDTQRATEASRQYSADYGLKSLQDLMSAGATQRGIEQEGITADKAQFEQQQAYPFNMVEFQRKLVEGLPIGASTTAVNQDAVSKMQSDISGLASLYKTLANLGVKT